MSINLPNVPFINSNIVMIGLATILIILLIILLGMLSDAITKIKSGLKGLFTCLINKIIIPLGKLIKWLVVTALAFVKWAFKLAVLTTVFLMALPFKIVLHLIFFKKSNRFKIAEAEAKAKKKAERQAEIW